MGKNRYMRAHNGVMACCLALALCGCAVIEIQIETGTFQAAETTQTPQPIGEAQPQKKPPSLLDESFQGNEEAISELAWEWHEIDLYHLQLSTPESWKIEETHRRSEPEEPGSPIKGHDCAEYVITDPSEIVILTLRPTCGFADGGSQALPEDAAIVTNEREGDWIIRYYDGVRLRYLYSDAGLATISDSQGTRNEMRLNDPPLVAIGPGQDITLVAIDFQFNGPESELGKTLPIVDKIVASIQGY